MNLLIGADPEVFARRNGQLVSAHGMIPGTKDNPYLVRDGAVQVDGMALEFNISPAKNADMFTQNIHSVLAQLKDMVPDVDLDFSPVAEFGKELIDAQPFEARRLGCEPDYCAYTKRVNNPPNADAPFRTASGHIHIGWTKGMRPTSPAHFHACCLLARELDVWLGIPFAAVEGPNKRRELYGKPGAFRPKSYGMEYRVLSNVWLKHPEWIEFVFNTVHRVFNRLVSGRSYGVKNGRVEVARQFNDPEIYLKTYFGVGEVPNVR